jgi:lipopolysaccharide/colanic/teichoic acid biosynthesis glycosyltransferase
MSFVGPRPQMRVDFEIYPDGMRERIYDVRPGITGVGSIVFRDEERLLSRPGVDPRAFYVERIAPYKAELEMWYHDRQSFGIDFMLLVLTAGAVLSPRSDAVYRVFRDLPARPDWLD